MAVQGGADGETGDAKTSLGQEDEDEEELQTEIGDYEQDDEDDDEDEEYDPGMDLSDNRLLIQLLMQQQLSAGIPITSRVFDFDRSAHFDAVACSLQGYRDNMEDAHLVRFELRNHADCSVFGVFDGHGGDLTSAFIQNTLVGLLEDTEHFDDESLIRLVKQLDLKWIEFENERKLTKERQKEQEALQFTMDSEEESDEADSEESAPAQPPPLGMQTVSTNEYGCVGSTMVFSLVQWNPTSETYRITTVNLGDSRAILLRLQEDSDKLEAEDDDDAAQSGRYRLVELSKDHKPDDPEEKARIIKAGGHVQFNRVDGDLALSRAIGDVRYKLNDALPREEQKISCVPTISHQTCRAGDYLMLYCDGIVECKDNEDVLAMISQAIATFMPPDKLPPSDDAIARHLRDVELEYLKSTASLGFVPRHTSELRGLAKCLLELTEWALDSGSKDNMTAIMVKVGTRDSDEATEAKEAKESESEHARVWSPGDFFRHNREFSKIGADGEVTDKDKITLDRFMRLFEADCASAGWNMTQKYENALLKKVLHINDLISNAQEAKEMRRIVEAENEKLEELEREAKEKVANPRKRKIDESESGAEEVGSPTRKRRKLNTD